MSEARAWKLLDEIRKCYQEILGSQLTGMYAHGSLAFDCFSWERSDIDFLVVVEEKPTIEQKIALIQTLLDRNHEAPDKGFEMSVVLKNECGLFSYPTPYELHFSNAHIERCRENVRLYCENMNGADPDLAAHFKVTRAVGRVICGEAIEKVFSEVPKCAYLDSIIGDVQGAEEEIMENPVYMVLNLCRVLAAVAEDKVLSKEQGGRWGKENLPEPSDRLVDSALSAYVSGTPFRPDEAAAKAFAKDMIRRITELKEA